MNAFKLAMSVALLALLVFLLPVEGAQSPPEAASRADGDCEFSRSDRSILPAIDLDRLEVNAGAGALVVRGDADWGTLVEVEATLCASSAELLDGLSATLEQEGGAAVVETGYPEMGGFFSGGRYARIDLTVLAPRGIEAAIVDGSGSIELARLGPTTLTDGSGSVDIREMVGALTVTDGSGSLSALDLQGDVRLTDGSGSVDIERVDGSVYVTDGSGSVVITDVTGDVRFAADGSGSIEVRGVGGDFIVDADGSGSIVYDRVAGRVSLPRGSG